MPLDNDFADYIRNMALIRERMARAAERVGRTPEAVRLVGVTKTVDVERIAAAVRAGVTEFGENYVQEARSKIPTVNAALKPGPSPVWHLIGHLQSNKAKHSVALFSLIHSVDNLSLAQEIGRQAAKIGKIQRVLIEVNLAGDEARAGVPLEATLQLADQVAQTPHLELRGLMGIAPYGPDAEAARPYFRSLYQMWERLPDAHRHELSMGMSGDFEVAIEEGATLVRIGTALFGSRKARN
jgi:hypothetical protein